MGFLAPALLAGLAALAVPVLLHLMQRERHQVVEFPSLMFLRKIPQEVTKRRRLQHWLLLAARCLVLLLVVAAFARPFLRDRTLIVTPTRGARDVVLLVDRSYSMAYGDRWARAVAATRQAIDELGGDDRATLVFFDQAAVAATEPTGDRAVLAALLEGAHPGSGSTRYGPALKLAQSILEDSDRIRREVVLVTDFQRTAWDGAPDVRFPAGTVLTPVDLSVERTNNVAVTSVELERGREDGREMATVTARVRHRGDGEPGARPLALVVNGRTMQTLPASPPANGTGAVRFAPFALPPGAVRATVQLAAGDPLPADDVFHFVVARGQERSVLVVEPAGAPTATSLYLTRALALARDPSYDVLVRGADRLRAADLEGRALVVLNDVALPGGDVGRRLADFVRGGGGLLVTLGDRAGNARWSGPLAELAPLSIGGATDRREGTGAQLTASDRTHPVFAPFRAARGNLGETRVFRYRELQPSPQTRVLARYDDGAIALAELPVERGRVLVFTSTFDAAWSDLPLQPMFLPLVHELARHAAGAPPVAPWLTAGERVDIAQYAAMLDGGLASVRAAAGAATTPWLAIAPSGARVRTEGAGVPVLPLDEAGFYEARPLAESGARVVPLAVNVDPAEGDLTRIDPAELAVALNAGAGSGTATMAAPGGAASRMLTTGEQEERQALWWYLLAATMLLVCVEALYANRLAARTR